MNNNSFIAALKPSSGSTPNALRRYGNCAIGDRGRSQRRVGYFGEDDQVVAAMKLLCAAMNQAMT